MSSGLCVDLLGLDVGCDASSTSSPTSGTVPASLSSSLASTTESSPIRSTLLTYSTSPLTHIVHSSSIDSDVTIPLSATVTSQPSPVSSSLPQVLPSTTVQSEWTTSVSVSVGSRTHFSSASTTASSLAWSTASSQSSLLHSHSAQPAAASVAENVTSPQHMRFPWTAVIACAIVGGIFIVSLFVWFSRRRYCRWHDMQMRREPALISILMLYRWRKHNFISCRFRGLTYAGDCTSGRP